MTTFDRFDPFERRITDAIDEIAAARPPAYLNDILRQTARSSQRPRWTFPERWLLVDTALSRPGIARGKPARLLVILALLAALAAAAWAGTRLLERPNPQFPAPFGPARNGLIAFSIGADLFLGDPRSGSSRLLASGVGSDPVFDRSGIRMATSRTSPTAAPCYAPTPVPACTANVVVTDLGGRSIVATPEPLPWPVLIRDWSPDGRSILVTAGPSDTIHLVAANGSADREIHAFANLVQPRFAGPDGTSIWIDERAAMGGLLPMRVGLDGQPLSRFTSLPGRENLTFDVAPGGQRIAIGGDGSSVIIARLDGSMERSIDLGPDVDHVSGVAWSPAGDVLAVEVIRNDVHSVALVDPTDAVPPRAIDPQVEGTCSWAPDGGSLLCVNDVAGWLIFDRLAGVRVTGWRDAVYSPSWQRLALEENPE